ncbi:amidohydrolase family protein [Bacteroidota bacterium]
MKKSLSLFLFLFIFTIGALYSQTKNIKSGERYDKLIIRNAIIIDGKGTPPTGPSDVIVEGNKIQSIRSARTGMDAYKNEKHVIDASGMYLLPGLINNHAHIHIRRNCSQEYVYKLWLACGITTVRDVGSNTKVTLEDRRKSEEGTIAAPRIFLYMRAGGSTIDQARESVRSIKENGGDGVKIFGMDRDLMKVVLDEAHKLDLKVAHHVGVEETDAWDDAEFGTSTIEHWYGIPDAALIGSQNFPGSYNYSNESDRFRYAGHLWRETDPEKLQKVLHTLVEKNVAWNPTFVIYEANRDLLRAVNQPWFKNYLHPEVEKYFVPNPANHGSYQWNWSTTDEIFWKENYKIWMKAVKDFANMGGLVGVGEDAGYIYMLYGFSLIRELELHQEAGFHPIDVIQHATGNNAKILGIDDKIGRIRTGYLADIILVEGNPLENLKFLYPTGVMDIEDGKIVYKGGVKWTIKDGFIYDAPAMLKEVKKHS